jgi:hypothetical protein
MLLWLIGIHCQMNLVFPANPASISISSSFRTRKHHLPPEQSWPEIAIAIRVSSSQIPDSNLLMATEDHVPDQSKNRRWSFLPPISPPELMNCHQCALPSQVAVDDLKTCI